MDSAGGRILIVDDDALLLKAMDSYLSRLGYRVDACRSATEAWTLVELNPSRYAGALVDLNLPGMRGEEGTGPADTGLECVDPSGGDERLSGRVERRDFGRKRGQLSVQAFRPARVGRRA